MNNVNETLYIRILEWAYRKQEDGFTWAELSKQFKLTKKQEDWVQRTFRSNMSAAENLIDHLSYADKDDSHFYVITPKGISEAINYLNLKEAEEGGKRAERIAVVAIIVGVIVGVVQIVIGLIQFYCF
jgi:hypothetical protein